MIASSPFDLIRPFLWVAAFAFVLGFAGYALMGAGSVAKTPAHYRDLAPVEGPGAPPAAHGPTIIA